MPDLGAAGGYVQHDVDAAGSAPDRGSLGGLVRAHRGRLRLTQEQLAERAGLSERTLRNLEGGRIRRPYPDTIRRLANALELTGKHRDQLEAAACRGTAGPASEGMGGGLEVGTVASSAVSPGPQEAGPPELGTTVAGALRASFLSPPPALLPMTVPAFVGRQGELASLDLLLASEGAAPPVVICAVSGTAGVGKTALAVHWAHRMRASFSDGQLYLNLRGFDPAAPPVQPGEAIRVFLDALAVPTHRIPVGLAEQVGLYRSLVADRRILVVLDNARDAEQVRPLLPGGEAARVVVTSRNPLLGLVAAEGAQPVPLGTMNASEAEELLRPRLGRARVERDPKATAEIIERCGGLPLALALVAARVAAHPRFTLQQLVEELRHSATPLDSMTAGQDRTIDLRHVFSWSYATLSEPGKALFRVFGLHPGPHLSLAAAASMSGRGLEATRDTLDELQGAGLVIEPTPGVYTVHDLLAAYARELTTQDEPEAARDAAVQRLLDHYLLTAVAADRQLEPRRDPIQISAPHAGTVLAPPGTRPAALAWFAQELPALLRAVELADAHKLDDHAWRLAWALVTYFDLQGHWQAFKATQGVALAAAQRLGNAEAEGRALRHLANATIQMGDLDEANGYLHRALALFERLEDQAAQATAHMNLAVLRERQERIEESNDHAAQALRLFRAAGHRVGEGIALNSLGYGYALLGEFPVALEHCHQALELDRANGHRKGEAHTADSLGFIYGRLGDHAQATRWFRHALGLFRDFGDRYNEADALLNLGDVFAAMGDHAAATQSWGDAAQIMRELDHPREAEARQRLSAASTS
jgi:tetratricopeptide (TPR) repeat protein/DNA-binding XRE family transcriptional regulator